MLVESQGSAARAWPVGSCASLSGEPMKRKQNGLERRRQPRVRLSKKMVGTVQTTLGASIIDLSVGGALLELSYALKPGGWCVFRLPLEGEETLKLNGRVVRSTLHALLPKAAGEGLASYRVAIEFVDLTPDERNVLEQRLLNLEGQITGQRAGKGDDENGATTAVPETEIVVELDADLPAVPPPAGHRRR
jgi:hypothetical protein